MILLAAAHQSRPAGVADRDHEPLYDQALLATPRCVIGRYRTDDGHPGHALKGIARCDDGRLLATTERELLWLSEEGRVLSRRSHPSFNDVHHAIEHDGAVWVASTGADAVVELRGDEVTVHALAEQLPEGDLRGRNLKPHRVHPNHLFVWRDQMWVTCLHQGHARSLHTAEILPVDEERIHDGVVHDGWVWFTTVDGRVVGTDGQQRTEIDLNELDGGGEPLGWCRGLAFDDDGTLWVGMTRLRATRWRHHLAWLRGRLRGRVEVSRRPTRLLRIDHTTPSVLEEIHLEGMGVHAVFGLWYASGR
jgi:ligand-binding sensor domain-containing protein